MATETPLTTENRSRANPLQEALAGPKGALDRYLEDRDEKEVRADILALTGMQWAERRMFAAMAMQGLRADGEPFDSDELAKIAVADADALLKELAK